MSLLESTIADYQDAHGDTEAESLYHEKIKQLENTRFNNTELVYPWSFEIVSGFFKQSEATTDDLSFNYSTDDFGRLKPWAQIKQELDDLNSNARDNEVYKVIFCARHGQGYHNTIVSKYGYPEWDRKWHALTQDGDVVYAPDPELTPLGIKQAQENNKAWKREVAVGAPIPSKFYSSPLQRSCYTLLYTWDGIRPSENRPRVLETIRETTGLNLCDKRSNRSTICERFEKHGFVIDESVTEKDELFSTVYREKLHEHAIRTNSFLQGLFDEDWDRSANKVDKSLSRNHSFVSTTTHAGCIRTFIIVTGHRHFTIPTGGMIPLVVRATRRV